MASVFSGFLPVAELSRVGRRWSKSPSRTLLWPVWVRRVAAPLGAKGNLGPFERAVLGCAQAGIQDPEHIGGLLCIDPKLVRVIQINLRQHRALNDAMSLTDDGLAMLGAGEIDVADVKVAHVFACAVTGRLLPRIAENFSFAEVYKEGTRFIHETGTKGSPKRHTCIHLAPHSSDEPPVPDAVEVFDAIRRHFAAYRSFEETSDTSVDNGSVPEVTSPSALGRVSVIDRRATPMFMLTKVHEISSGAATSESARRVDDPFGFGELTVLTKTLASLCAQRPDLERALKPKNVRPEGVLGAAASWDEIVAEARKIVADRLPHVDPNSPGLQHVIDMEEAKFQWELVGPSRPGDSRFLREAARNARSAIEACFVTLSKSHPLTRLADRIRRLESNPQDVAFLKAKIEARVQQLGMHVPIPRRFQIRPNDLRSVVCYQHSSKLAAMVIATAIVASEEPGHPFADLARGSPDLLVELDVALEIAGSASHHNETGKIEPRAVNDLISIVYRLWNSLIGQSANHLPNVPEKAYG